MPDAAPVHVPVGGAHHAVALALVPLRDGVLWACPPEQPFVVAGHRFPEVPPNAQPLRQSVDHELGEEALSPPAADDGCPAITLLDVHPAGITLEEAGLERAPKRRREQCPQAPEVDRGIS